MQALAISTLIRSILPKRPGGSLRFYGRWHGRPYDNYQRIINSSSKGETLTIDFDGGETLRIWQPLNVTLEPKNIIIGRANCVEFERDHFSAPEKGEIRALDRYCEWNYRDTNSKSLKVYNNKIDLNFPAVELLSF